MSPSFLWVTKRIFVTMNTRAGSWPRWNRSVCLSTHQFNASSLALTDCLFHPSRSQLSPMRAETWPTASVPLATWSVPPRPRTACGKYLRWPPERRCRSANARGEVPASCCEVTAHRLLSLSYLKSKAFVEYISVTDTDNATEEKWKTDSPV